MEEATTYPPLLGEYLQKVEALSQLENDISFKYGMSAAQCLVIVILMEMRSGGYNDIAERAFLSVNVVKAACQQLAGRDPPLVSVSSTVRGPAKVSVALTTGGRARYREMSARK